MNDLIYFICGDAVDFTPQVMVGLIVFVCYLEALFGLIASMIGGVRK